MNKVLQLKNKLAQLAILDATFQVFGSEAHQYQLNPCLREVDVQLFESRYKVMLPSDYRNFLLEVGNGGAGPGYGLDKIFGIADENVVLETAYPEKYELLSKPFPFSKAWNDLDLISKNRVGNFVNSNAYFDEKFTQGTLSIANYGCGIYAMLVITGEQSGKIWIDDRTNDNGIYPASRSFCHSFHSADIDDFHSDSNEEQPLSFYEWYEDWLNQSLHQIRQYSQI